jgi:hypothetical protein
MLRYETGLMKLENSANDVNIMQADLELLQPKLEASSNEVMDLLRVCFHLSLLLYILGHAIM